MNSTIRIGILALQGGFAEHAQILQSFHIQSFEIRKKADLNQSMNGLIIPGGESTTIGKLLQDLDMFDELESMIKQGMPVFGTCAGMILLAKEIDGRSVARLGVIDIKVKRNAYGRQLGSFFTEAEFEGVGVIPMTFIRAPYIESIGPNVKVLSTVDGNIVAAKEKNILVTSYHPELTSDNRVHKYFVENFIL